MFVVFWEANIEGFWLLKSAIRIKQKLGSVSTYC